MESDEKKEKQSYLCSKILNAGYDSEEFASYLQKIKGNVWIIVSEWSEC